MILCGKLLRHSNSELVITPSYSITGTLTVMLIVLKHFSREDLTMRVNCFPHSLIWSKCYVGLFFQLVNIITNVIELLRSVAAILGRLCETWVWYKLFSSMCSLDAMLPYYLLKGSTFTLIFPVIIHLWFDMVQAWRWYRYRSGS